MQTEFFDGYPYLATRVSPCLYHLLVLPCELPLDHLRAVTGWQATANRMPACLVLGPERCIYFEPDGRERASGVIPHGGVQVANLLLPCYPLPANPETMERVQRLEQWVQANRPSGGYLFGDLTKGGRRATDEEVLRLGGCNGNGVPKGLARCAMCGDWRGECLDPNPQFAGMVMQVHCRCQNDTLCARCAKPLYERKLNANVFHEGAVWHVPGFCAFRHRCDGGEGGAVQ